MQSNQADTLASLFCIASICRIVYPVYGNKSKRSGKIADDSFLLSSKMQSNQADTLASLFRNCTTLPALRRLHAHLLRLSLHHNPSLTSSLITLYSTLATPLHSLRVFSSSTNTPAIPSLLLFTTTIRALSKSQPLHALRLYRQLLRLRLSPDNHTFPFLLISCSKLPSLPCGSELHGRILRTGLFNCLHVSNALVDMYGKIGELGFARKVFSEMPIKDVVTYNVVLGAHARLGEEMELASDVFEEMPERSLIAWNAMVVGYVRSDDLKAARAVFDEMSERNLVTWNTMVVGYVKSGMVDDAREVFDAMPDRNLISWAAMISGYAQSGRPNEALEVFKEMETRLTSPPDAATMIGVISSVAQLGGNDLANWVGSYVDRKGIERNQRILTGLVDMHAKCGNLEKARRVFSGIHSKDLLSYTALINGLAAHGHGLEALELFNTMQADGITPDRVAFIGVLNACRHTGLIDPCLKLWHKMVNQFGITPDSDHYACVIDMLGRSGRVEEAYQLVRTMPAAAGPNVGALGAVLAAACRSSLSEVGTAEAVAHELFVLEPENTGNYILLWSLYASRGEWTKAEVLRRTMDMKGMTKLPAYSSM